MRSAPIELQLELGLRMNRIDRARCRLSAASRMCEIFVSSPLVLLEFRACLKYSAISANIRHKQHCYCPSGSSTATLLQTRTLSSSQRGAEDFVLHSDPNNLADPRQPPLLKQKLVRSTVELPSNAYGDMLISVTAPSTFLDATRRLRRGFWMLIIL